MFQAALISMFRQLFMIKQDPRQHLHLCELCALVGSATPAGILHAERLRQLLAQGPDALWALIKQDVTACDPFKGWDGLAK